MARPDQRLPTILIGDDEPAILRLLALFLGGHRFDVLTVGGGAEAVEVYHRVRGEIDLVLLDVPRPLPWDGPRTRAELREIGPNVCAAFMTGSTGRYTAEEVLAAGASRVFDKPFPSLSALVAARKEMLPVSVKQ